MNSDGVCTVGINRLAREIKLDERPTTKAICELEAAGWIDVIRETNHSNRYFALIPHRMDRAVALLARERKGGSRHSLLVRAAAPVLAAEILASLGVDPLEVEPLEIRKVVGRIMQLLTRTFDIEWESVRIAEWVLVELPLEIREPVGYVLTRLSAYGRFFKGRLSRDPRTVSPGVLVPNPIVVSTIEKVACQISATTSHQWLK